MPSVRQYPDSGPGERDNHTQKIRSHRARPWSADGSLEDAELMAEREVLEGDGRRPEEYGAKDRPETNHEYHGRTPASGMASEPRLYRISTGGGEVSSGGPVDGVLDQDNGSVRMEPPCSFRHTPQRRRPLHEQGCSDRLRGFQALSRDT